MTGYSRRIRRRSCKNQRGAGALIKRLFSQWSSSFTPVEVFVGIPLTLFQYKNFVKWRYNWAIHAINHIYLAPVIHCLAMLMRTLQGKVDKVADRLSACGRWLKLALS